MMNAPNACDVNYFISKEWISIIEKFKAGHPKVPDFQQCCQLVSDLYRERMNNLRDLEIIFRRDKIPIFLFGEQPEKSQYSKGHKPPEGKAYLLAIAVGWDRSEHLENIDPNCTNIINNLDRLLETGFIQIGENLEQETAKIVKALCNEAPAYSIYEYKDPMYSAIMNHFEHHGNDSIMIFLKRITIKKLL